MSARNRERIFEWAKQAQYFAGKIDSGNHKLAFTGTKMLSYQDGQRSNTARYNYSNLAAVQQLTTLFQNMAGTLEYGRRLAYYHRYQKLALDDELKRMEAQAKNNELSEIQGVAPVLQEILEDTFGDQRGAGASEGVDPDGEWTCGWPVSRCTPDLGYYYPRQTVF